MKYEFENIDEYLNALIRADCSSVGLSVGFSEGEAQPVAKEGRLVQGKRVTALLTLTSVTFVGDEKTLLAYQEPLFNEVVASDDDIKPLNGMVEKKIGETIRTIQDKAQKIIIFRGRVLP